MRGSGVRVTQAAPVPDPKSVIRAFPDRRALLANSLGASGERSQALAMEKRDHRAAGHAVRTRNFERLRIDLRLVARIGRLPWRENP